MLEKTLLVIKPDAVKRKLVGEIIKCLESDFEILDIKLVHLSKSQAEVFYSIHKDRDFFSGLVDFIVSGPVVALLLQGENAVERLREVIGATDPKQAKPGTIRARFGSSMRENVVHASSPLENPEQEIEFYFPKVSRKK